MVPLHRVPCLALLLAVLLVPPLQAASTAAAQEAPLPQEPADTAPPADTLPEPAVPVDRAALDRDIEEELQATLSRVESLRNVRVGVEAGVVTLSGTVLSPEARERAAELAGAMEGVVFVENRIREDPSLAARLRPALERLRLRLVTFVAYLPLLAVALALIVAFAVVGAVVGRWEWPWARVTRNPFLQTLLGQAVRVVLVVTGLLLALELLEATALVGAVLGTAGLAGLAIGFAFKDIVENYLAGIILSLRQPFAPNDHVLVESHEGKVVRLTARETILMTLEGNHVRIPNATVFRSVMLNYTRNPLRAFEFSVAVAPAEDLSRAQEEGIASLRAMKGVIDQPPPSAFVDELGDSWVAVRYKGWMDQGEADWTRVRSEAIRLVKARLDAAGVEMPSPEYRLRVRREGVAAEGEPAPPAAAPQQDVSPDRDLDAQIEHDRRTADEEDLLRPEGE